MPAPTSLPTTSGSRISSIPQRKNFGSQSRWGLVAPVAQPPERHRPSQDSRQGGAEDRDLTAPIKILRHPRIAGMRKERRADGEVKQDQRGDDFHRAPPVGQWPAGLWPQIGL